MALTSGVNRSAVARSTRIGEVLPACLSLACLLFACLLLGSCGFALRGSGSDRLGAGVIFVDAQLGVTINRALRERIRERDLALTLDRDEADVLFWLSNEVESRRVLSVTRTGRVGEYELRHAIDMLIVHGEEGRPPRYSTDQKPNRVVVLREYTYDEAAVLGKEDEEAILRAEMRDELVNHLLLRLEATVR